jgi:hypothetical protein
MRVTVDACRQPGVNEQTYYRSDGVIRIVIAGLVKNRTTAAEKVAAVVSTQGVESNY